MKYRKVATTYLLTIEIKVKNSYIVLLHLIFLDVFFVFGGWFLQEKMFFFKLTLIYFFLIK